MDQQKIIDSVLKWLVSFLGKDEQINIAVEPIQEMPTPTVAKSMPNSIDWTNPECQVTEHFKVKDALMLHSWNKLASEADGANFDQLTILCKKMEEVRNILGCSINVHCMFRSEAYNASQNIKPAGDVHSKNLACDFDCNSTMSIMDVQAKLAPVLEQLNIRLEKGTTTWVHIDLRAPGPSGRYFTP